jgi:hypothetical protein
MKILLKQPHQHAGLLYPAGSTLEVDSHIGIWLITHDIATEVSIAVLRKPISRNTPPIPEENE